MTAAFADRADVRRLSRSDDWRRALVNWRATPPAAGAVRTCRDCAYFVSRTGLCLAMGAQTRGGATCDHFHR